jgi:hypothetical protein
MLFKCAFITQAWNLVFERDPDQAIKSSPWSQLDDDLTPYVSLAARVPRSLKAHVREIEPDEIALHESLHPEWHVFEDFVAVEFVFDWDEPLWTAAASWALERGLSQEKSEESATRYLSWVGNSIAQRFLMIGNLSVPALASSRFCILSAENGFREEGGCCHSWLDEIYEDEPLYSESPLPELPIIDCLQWSRNLNGLWRNLPQTNVERSFAYFSYIFDRAFHGTTFQEAMWSIGALDALYCESSVGISEKLKRRIPLIIADIDRSKIRKAVNMIYADRSRTFHGDIRFVSNFFDPYLELEHAESHANLFKSLPSVYYVLIRTYQYLILNGLTWLNFEEHVNS